MSVSLAVGARPTQPAQMTALSAASWTVQAETVSGEAFELSGTRLHVVPDREIYAEGDEARSFYKVISGVVRTCRFLNDGRRQIEAFHRAGDVFGFEAGAVHQLTAEAVSECVVMAYRRRGLETMVAHDDRLGRWFFSHAMTVMARLREHAMLLARASAAQKISTFLLEAAAQEGGNTLELPMSRQDIADYLGLTIETISRTMTSLQDDQLIALTSSRQVLLRDRPALLDLAA